MTTQADWPTTGPPVDSDSAVPLFFDEHQWTTIEAATARIIPSDHDPGAREARVVVFIDRYLSGIEYIYAAADGSGFLRMSGKPAGAWAERITEMQGKYRAGIDRLDEIGNRRFGATFSGLTDRQQDAVLEELSGAPAPGPVSVGRGQPAAQMSQGAWEDDLDFWSLLLLHTRQGFYGDPVYGGNKDRVGWKVIGFPGPESLGDTVTCKYNLRQYYVLDFDWAELIPHLREQATAED